MNWNVQTRNEEGFLCGSCAPHYLIYDLRVRREMVFRWNRTLDIKKTDLLACCYPDSLCGLQEQDHVVKEIWYALSLFPPSLSLSLSLLLPFLLCVPNVFALKLNNVNCMFVERAKDSWISQCICQCGFLLLFCGVGGQNVWVVCCMYPLYWICMMLLCISDIVQCFELIISYGI